MNDRYLFKAKRKLWRKFTKEEQWIIWDAIKGKPSEAILKDTICQCTGLKDKNGNLIWENDVCDRKERVPEIVNYNNGDWQLDYSYAYEKERGCDCCNLGFYVKERKCVEVIGNIFDNPELLEVE